MKRLAAQRGDTIVEVVIAMAILTLGLTVAYNVANHSFRLGTQARERTQASYIAQSQAEKLTQYRDAVEQQATAQGSTADIMNTAANFANCVGSGCAMTQWAATASPFNYTQTKGLWHPVVGSLCLDATGAAVGSGCFYTVTITAPPYVHAINQTSTMKFTITVTWTSAIGSDPNKVVIPVDLGDTRNGEPLDCSVAGSCT